MIIINFLDGKPQLDDGTSVFADGSKAEFLGGHLLRLYDGDFVLSGENTGSTDILVFDSSLDAKGMDITSSMILMGTKASNLNVSARIFQIRLNTLLKDSKANDIIISNHSTFDGVVETQSISFTPISLAYGILHLEDNAVLKVPGLGSIESFKSHLVGKGLIYSKSENLYYNIYGEVVVKDADIAAFAPIYEELVFKQTLKDYNYKIAKAINTLKSDIDLLSTAQIHSQIQDNALL